MSFKWEYAFGKVMLSCITVFGLSTNLRAGSEEKKPNFAFAYPKDLNLTNPRDFYFYVEGLAFQGMESGLPFCIVDKASAAYTLDGRIGNFSSDHSSWDYNFGTRVGWGLYLDHDAWNFDLSWLWVNVTNSQSFEAHSGSTLPIWIPDFGASLTTGSSGANWGCTVNVLDALLGKPYHISRKVIFNPHFGLRTAWIDQDYTANYGSSTPATKSKFEADNDFFGIGAKVGVNTDWLLGRGFKLFANLSSSVLAGWFDTSQRFTIPSGNTSPNVHLKDDPQMVVPNLEIAAGFDWGTYLDNCNFYLDFRAGYEFQVWWDQWNMRQFITGVSDGNYNSVAVPGNLMLNGFTFKIQLDM